MPFTPDKPTPGFQPDPEPKANGFQVANNIESATEKSGLRKLADMATAGVGGIAKGMTFGLAKAQYPGMEEAMKEHPTAAGAGEIAGSAATAGGLASGVAKGLGGTFLGRTVGNTAAGALQGAAQPGDHVNNAIAGGIAGGSLGALGEGIQSIIGGVGRMGDTVKKAFQIKSGSPALSEEAIGQMRGTADKLRNSGAKSTLDSLLGKSSIEVDAQQLLGKSPEVDQMLASKLGKSGGTKVQLQADEANKVREMLYKAGDAKGSMYLSDSLHKISPEVDSAMKDTNSAMNAATMLTRKSGGITPKPISTLTSESPDVRAQLRKADELAGTDISSYASQLRSAKNLGDNPLKGAPGLAYQGLVGGAKSLGKEAGVANSPLSLQALFSALFSGSDNKK